MRSLKSFKFVVILVTIFSLSACELIEEPNFEEQTTEGGGESSADYDMD
jgi:hypothetical protein